MLAALVTSLLEPEDELTAFTPLQDVLIADLVHDFAYLARKTYEIAKRAGFPIRDALERESIACAGTSTDCPLYFRSLHFILDRLIHSDVFSVERGNVPIQIGDDAVTYRRGAWGFTVGSERDRGADHFVLSEIFLREYLVVDGIIGAVLEDYERTRTLGDPG